MPDQNTKNKKTYTEAQVTRWLSWLARGMQQHGQTIFLIEQLQPSWLLTRGQRRVYLLCSRLLEGLIFWQIVLLFIGLTNGLTQKNYNSPHLVDVLVFAIMSGLIFGLILGLSLALVDIFRLEHSRLSERFKKMSTRWQTFLNILMIASLLMLLSFLSLFLNMFLKLFMKSLDSDFIGTVLGIGMIFALGGGILWGIRVTHRSMSNDIQTVETLRFSHEHARKSSSGVLKGWLVFGLIVGLILGYIVGINDFWQWGVAVGVFAALCLMLLGLIHGLIRWVFGGLKRGIAEMKTVPNQGIKLTMKNAVLGGVWVALILGIIPGIIGMRLFGSIGGFISISGFITGPLAFLWFGGLDVIQHYILRYILYYKGYTPFDFAHFLDYAANELNFLQKVGGGYIFIHRYLLEHFAELAEPGEANGKSSENQTPATSTSETENLVIS